MPSLRSILCCLWFAVYASASSAQVSTVQRHFNGKPETDINVGIFASLHKNCTPAPLPALRIISPPAHGKITVKQGRLRATNLPQCLALEVPAFVAIYRSQKDFLGQDTFTLEVNANGKQQQQVITVTVAPPGAKSGI